MSPQIEEITDNGTESFTPAQRGKHLIIIGSNAGDDLAFDSGDVTVQQHGITLDDVDGTALSAVGAATRAIVDGLIDEPIDFVVANVAGAAANIDIKIYKLPDA